MADVEISILVTPNTDPPSTDPSDYSWSYVVLQGDQEVSDGTITVPYSTQVEIQMTIAAGGNPGDLCEFPSDPAQVLSFERWDHTPIATPQWCKEQAVPAPSLYIFTD